MSVNNGCCLSVYNANKTFKPLIYDSIIRNVVSYAEFSSQNSLLLRHNESYLVKTKHFIACSRYLLRLKLLFMGKFYLNLFVMTS